MSYGKACDKLYGEYKYLCKKVNECKLLTINNTLEELNTHLTDIIYQYTSFQTCKEKRLKYTEKCYNNIMDAGHQKQIDILDTGISKCNIVINNLKSIIRKKSKQLLHSINLINQIDDGYTLVHKKNRL